MSAGAKLPQRWLAELVDSTDIAEVIRGYIKLIRAGKEYRACCPFHAEKTPSFTVNVEKRFWHCFGCGKHGNVIDFVTQYGRIGFRDAVRDLARRAGMKVPLPSKSEDDRRREREMMRACQRLHRFFRSQLAGQMGRLRDLGIDEKLARRFHVGYAPPAYAIPPESMGALRHAGLVNEHGQLRLTDRLVMPITTTRGDIIGLVAPASPNSTAEPPIVCGLPSSHEQLIHDPARTRKPPRELFVVPSPLDLLQLTSIGLPAVAIPKLHPMSVHFVLLSRLADNIVLCLPSGTAGNQLTVLAAHEYADVLKPGIASTRVLTFPPDKPFASAVREVGAAAFELRARDAEPLLHTALRVLPLLLNRNNPHDRRRYLGHMIRFAKAPSPAVGIVTSESLTQSWGIPTSEANRAIQRSGLRPAQVDDHLSVGSPALRLLSALLRDPSCVRYLADIPYSDDPNFGLVQELVAYLRDAPADSIPDASRFIDQHPKRALFKQLTAQPFSAEPIVHLVESMDALATKATGSRLPESTASVRQRASPSR